jgi:nitrate/nitrite transport system permease protein
MTTTQSPASEPMVTLETAGGPAPIPPHDGGDVVIVGPPKPPSRVRDALVSVAFGALGFAVFVALWAVVSVRNSDLPGPLDAWEQLRTLVSDGFATSGPNGQGIFRDLGDSLELALKGFGLAALVGIPLGLLAGSSRRAWQAVNPLVQLLKPVSPLAWFPIFLVAFKDTSEAALFVVFVCALWPMVLNTAVGAASVPVDQRNVARVFRFGRRTYLRQVVVPHTVPSIITGMRLSMGIAWMVIVAAEMLSGSSGVGFFIWNSYNAGNLAAVMAAIVLVGIVGVILDTLFVYAGKQYTGEAH